MDIDISCSNTESWKTFLSHAKFGAFKKYVAINVIM